METLTEQLSIALESARLYEDTQRQAQHDRISREMASTIRETLDIDTVLQTAIKEISETLNIDDVEVRLSRSSLSTITE
jgi:GAF domain-containing protein